MVKYLLQKPYTTKKRGFINTMATLGAKATFEERTMTLSEIEGRIGNFQSEVTNLRRRIRDLISQSAKAKENQKGWLVQVALDEERCDLEAIARSLLNDMERLGNILESKQGAAFRDYERNILLREQLKKCHDIAACIIEQVNAGMSASEIENKLARTFGGEYRWRALVGNCLLTDIHDFFRNPNNLEIKQRMLDSLQKIKVDIEPDAVEGGEKTRKLRNLQQIEERIQKSQGELTLIPAYAREVCCMMQSIKDAQAKLAKLFP